MQKWPGSTRHQTTTGTSSCRAASCRRQGRMSHNLGLPIALGFLPHRLGALRRDAKPHLGALLGHELGVMLQDHLRAIPRLQRHLRRVRHRRQPVADERVPERIVFPGERLPASSVRRLSCLADFLWPGSQRWLRFYLLRRSSPLCDTAVTRL